MQYADRAAGTPCPHALTQNGSSARSDNNLALALYEHIFREDQSLVGLIAVRWELQ